MISHYRDFELLLFDAALQIEGEPRRLEFLDLVCSKDLAMRERLHQLLAVHQESQSFFAGVVASCSASTMEEPATEPSEPNASSDQIGCYRIIERIGEGGCGVVYLAEQEYPLRRQVALKVIRMGLDTDRVIARFQSERQALALMDHPCIAHALDAGSTPTGRPYFAMELVRGLKITEFCDQHQLSIRERVELFMKVCHAIQHAHQKGVIHRDIKPSNVIVMLQDGEPQPKVIDFGIAKAMEGTEFHALLKSSDSSKEKGGMSESCLANTDSSPVAWNSRHVALTGTRTDASGLPIGTLAAMSPEQAMHGGAEVDTRSDIYSLGLLLHEMICGLPACDPAELNAVGFEQALEIIVQRDVPNVTTVISSMGAEELRRRAYDRRSNPKKWLRDVRGDIEAILGKCLCKDRALRYESVGAIELDLYNYLAHEPVLAREKGRWYRFQKFAQRNRLAFAFSSALVLTITVGFAFSTTMYFRENAARQEQQKLRVMAENSRAAEVALKQQAQARSNVSLAALLLNQGKLQQADEVLRKTQLDMIEPSQEATRVFRELGDWHLQHQRWKRAASCYELLPFANRFIEPENITSYGDMIRTAPTLVMAGMDDAYDFHRQVMIQRFRDSGSVDTTEQLIKMSLLTSASDPVLQDLRTSVDFLKQHEKAQSGRIRMLMLAAISLYELRSKNYQQAIDWADRALELLNDRVSVFDEYRIFLRSIILISSQKTGDSARVAVEKCLVKAYYQMHEDPSKWRFESTNPHYVIVIERMMAWLMVREAMAEG
jgi:serine/threonine protein kinase